MKSKLLYEIASFFFLFLSEILDFCDFVAPTPEEEESRTTAVQRVSDVIKHIWPDCKVYMLHLVHKNVIYYY
jgi:DNA polymerase sigma